MKWDELIKFVHSHYQKALDPLGPKFLILGLEVCAHECSWYIS